MGNAVITNLTKEDIRTIAVEVININNGEKTLPIYEAHGYAKFQEMVEWYRNNLKSYQIAYISGIGYHNGERQVITIEFVGGN